MSILRRDLKIHFGRFGHFEPSQRCIKNNMITAVLIHPLIFFSKKNARDLIWYHCVALDVPYP